MMQWLLTSEQQPTVWDDPSFPQYLSYFPDGSFGPLTAENDWTVLGDYQKKDSLIERIKKIFEDFRLICKLLWELIRN